jgi:putative transcriptional regulator
MVDILKSKNLASKFQILLEIASNQPIIPQKDIAQKLAITSQAVSEYVRELIGDGWLTSSGRSRYKVTKEGVDWILRMARQLHAYTSFVNEVVADIYVTTAIAVTDLNFNQPVSLYMQDGLLFASDIVNEKGAHGITISGAKKGEDIGVSNVGGVINLGIGKVTILKVPGIREGGSRNTDVNLLRKKISNCKLLGAIGVESIVVLKKIGINPDYIYGVKEAVVEAACHGLDIIVVCVDSVIPVLVENLKENSVYYDIIDLKIA